MDQLSEKIKNLSPRKKALLEKLMQEKGLEKGVPQGNTIPKRPHDGPYFPLSSAQQRLWFLNQFADTQEVFNVHSAVKLHINIDPKHLSQSVASIVERHESLRTLFKKIDGQPRQYVANSEMRCFEHHDLTHIIDDKNINHEIQHANDTQRKHIFDLQKGPLLKVTLLSFAPSFHVLILTLHHIVSDGVSISILMDELFNGYAALESGNPSELKAIDVQYIDYACWQQDRLNSKAVQTQLAFWTETLESAPQILDMQTDYPRPKKLSYLGRAHDFQISGDLLAQLKSRAKEWGCSPFMLGLTAYSIVLGRYSGQSDMLIGTDIANRNSLQIKPLIGFFINQLVLRCRWSGDPSLHELTQFIRQTCLRAYANQDVPFNHLVEQFVTERDQSRTPLFQAKFVLDNSVGAVSTPDQVAVIEWETEAVEFDIELAFKELDGLLEGRIRYRSELFSADTIESFADYFQSALTAIVEQPNLPLSELNLLMPAEQRLIQESNQTEESTAEIVLIDALLAYHKSKQNACAVQDVNAARSFSELKQDVEQMAAYFLDSGVASGDVVAVCVLRNVDLLIVHLALLRIGACYVPIDLDYGPRRIKYILDDSLASLLIVSSAHAALFSDSNPDQLVLPSDWRENWRADLPVMWPSVTSSQLAYMIYTSGSTGKPKGVAISLASLGNFLYSMKTLIDLNPGDSLLSVTTVSFDIAGLELYLPLLCKARLFIADQQHARDSRMLLSLIKSESISAMQATPATWSALCDVAGEQTLPSLCALCGGEALTEELAKRLLVFAGKLVNLYGPTETTIWSSALTVTKSNIEGLPYVPLGQPIANTQVYVLDANGNQQLSGVPGELCIAGHGLARGYQGRAALTAESFLPNPFLSDAGSRLYKTGDCVKRLHDGRLVYLGRYDHQVKVRGYRIEIGEIEVVLKLNKDVESAFVVAKRDATEFNTLHAFVCLTPSASKLIAQAQQTNTSESRLSSESDVATQAEVLQKACDSILNDAAQYLPSYMVPSVIQVLSKPPQTANGKVDRKALIAIAENSNYVDHAINKTAPSTDLECQIAAHWQNTLSLESVFLEQDFFRNGGHSLLAIQLLDRIEKDTLRRVSLEDFFALPTLEGLIKQIELNTEGSQAYPTIEPDPENKHEPFPLTDLQQAYLIGRQDGLDLGSIATQNYLEIDILNLDVEHFSACWNVIIERHDMLRVVFDDQGMQRILPSLDTYTPEFFDLSGMADSAREAQLQVLRGKMSQERMPEKTGPLFAIKISKRDDRQFRIHICVDMLISDVLSNLIVFGELDYLYRNVGPNLPTFSLSFRDYVLAELELKQSNYYQNAKRYWLDRLDDFPNAPELPLSRGVEAVKQQRFERRKHHIKADQWALIKDNAQALNISPTVLLLCAYSQVLATWSSSKHFALNLTLFNRLPLHDEVQQLVGDFTSSLLLELDIDASQNFAQRAGLIGSRLWRDLDNRLFSGVSVIRELNKLSGGTQQYNMPVVFTSMLGMESSLDEAGIADQTAGLSDDEEAGEEHYSVSQTSQVWLDHQVAEENDGLTLVWDAIDDLFPDDMLDDMFAAYCQLLDSLTEAKSWHKLTSLTPSAHLRKREQRAVVDEEKDLRLLHQLFEQQVRDHSDSVAIIAGDVTISYSQLEQWSQNLAALLIEKGAESNALIAIVMDKGWEQVVAAMAILKSGAAYLPINAELPDKRIAELLKDGECQLVLTQQNSLIEGRVQAWSNTDVKLSGLASIMISSDRLNLLPDRKVEQQVSLTDIAYVIFTSGSTGKPKGVVIDHRGAVNTVVDINRRFNVTSCDRVLAISSLSFDLSVYDIFGLLAVGGALVIPVGEQRHKASDWFKLVQKHDVTIWNSVPALMQLLVEHCESSVDEFLAKLSLIMMSGDWIPVDLPDRIQQLSSSCKVVSLGGATEASIWSIFHEINQSCGHLSSIPYGKPLTNQSFFVLNEEGFDCPNWVRGHLFIGGIGVAKGYWRDAEKTAYSFIQHEKYGLLYRTGDLGRYDDRGVIEFMGREDSQVKVQGYRVELGEIESALSQHPDISNSVVLAQGDRFSKTLVAYVVPQAGEPKDTDSLITDPLARSLFKLEQKSILQLPSSLTKLELPSLEKIGSSPANELGTDERAIFADKFRGKELLPTLGALLSGLRQEQVDSSPLPKYFYPSASSLYPVQLYLAIPTSSNEELVSDEERVTLYYFSAPECSLLQIGRSSIDRFSASFEMGMGNHTELPILYWVVDWDAITPMYPKDEAQRFVHLEIGYMLAIVRQQLIGLEGGLGRGLDLRWVSNYNPFAGAIIDAELAEAGMTLLSESSDCLLVGQIVDQSIEESRPDKEVSCHPPAKRILDGLLNCTSNIDLIDSVAAIGDLSDASYDVLKRQSIRSFTNKRVGLNSITGLLECCNYLAKSSLAILLFCKPQRCDDGLAGFYSYDARERQLRKAATNVKEEELIELYSGDNQSIFNDSAFALYFLSNADSQQAVELTHIGEASQHLMSVSWHFGLGLCPIGQVDQSLLSRLLCAESGSDNELLMLHGFVGGGITSEQLDVWEPEGAAAQPLKNDFTEQTDSLKAFLEDRLPAYMVPEVYIPLDSIPLSSNGKVDRKSLPSAELDADNSEHVVVAPSNAIEALLQRLWQEQFSVANVSVNDNFFHLGGNSLLAMRMIGTLLNEHGIELSLRKVFEEPTIAGLANEISKTVDGSATKLNIYTLATGDLPDGESIQRYPLTPGQQHLFAHHQTQEIKSAYNITTALRIRGKLDAQRLRQTLQALLDRHDALRTRFAYHDGEVCQLVDSKQELHFEIIALDNITSDGEEMAIKDQVRSAASHVFDLFNGPMLRCHLLALRVDDHVLILNVHHIIADFLSMDLIAKEMAFLYGQNNQELDLELGRLPLQFSNFLRWQQAFLQSEEANTQREFWLNTLKGIPLLRFPNEQQAMLNTQKDGWLEYQCPPQTFEAIESCCAEHEVTGFIVGLAALHQLLAHKTGQHDIGIGTPISNRFNQDLENIVGLMLNTLVVRIVSDDELRCDEFLGYVKRQVVDAFDNKDLPVEHVEREMNKVMGLGGRPNALYRVRYVYRNVEAHTQAPQPVMAIEALENERSQAKFDLLVTVNKSDHNLSGEFEYRHSALDDSAATSMQSLYVSVMHYLSENSDKTLADLKAYMDVLEADERVQRLAKLKQNKTNRLSNLARRKRRGTLAD